jgi:hypothetical protein
MRNTFGRCDRGGGPGHACLLHRRDIRIDGWSKVNADPSALLSVATGAGFEHREHSNWMRHEFDLEAKWFGMPPKANTRVRVTFRPGDVTATVLSVWFRVLGETQMPNTSTTHFFGLVQDDQTMIAV